MWWLDKKNIEGKGYNAEKNYVEVSTGETNLFNDFCFQYRKYSAISMD